MCNRKMIVVPVVAVVGTVVTVLTVLTVGVVAVVGDSVVNVVKVLVLSTTPHTHLLIIIYKYALIVIFAIKCRKFIGFFSVLFD